MEDIPEHLRPTSIILEVVKELEELKEKVRFVNDKEEEYIGLVKNL
jgi:tetrahydromethanopterin S-methyltransferase subunit G